MDVCVCVYVIAVFGKNEVLVPQRKEGKGEWWGVEERDSQRSCASDVTSCI